MLSIIANFRKLVVASILLFAASLTNSFQPRHGSAAFLESSRRPKLTDVASTASRSDEKKVAEPKNRALDALEKLKRRQISELEETDRLIGLLSRSGSDAEASAAVDEKKHGNLAKSLSAAASALYGFDYGFISRSEGAKFRLRGGKVGQTLISSSEYEGPPGNIFAVGAQQFMRNLNAIRGEYSDEDEEGPLTDKQIELREKLNELTLNATAIWERELKDGPIVAPFIIKIPYLAVCYLLDVVFDGRYVPARFFLLETVARMPYFSYITVSWSPNLVFLKLLVLFIHCFNPLIQIAILFSRCYTCTKH